MEIKKSLSNKYFLSGVLCGLFIAACFMGGFHYGKTTALESKSQTNIELSTEKN